MRRLNQSLTTTAGISIVVWFLSVLGPVAASAVLVPSHGATRADLGSLMLSPQDTYLNIDTNNYSSATTLTVYTWPDYHPANAILMKFDLSALPAGAVVTSATLQLALVETDAAADSTYTVSAHKVLGKNPIIAEATGYTAGAAAWTPNGCCSGGAPLAQADISPAYDARVIDKAPGFKAWTITTMVQEWLLTPATNFGLVLNADVSKPRDRYRIFASMEHASASLRPFLKVTFVAGDATPPSAVITAPSAGDVAGSVPLTATASDNVGVASVQFLLNGTPIGTEQAAFPYVVNWDSTTRSDGTYALTALVKDTSGNTATSPAVPVVVNNGTLVLSPQDTSLNINANNHSNDPVLMAYTWPDRQRANAILMKFDFSAVPPGAVVHDARLELALVQSDLMLLDAYTVTAHKVLGRDPVVSQATGYLANAGTTWTPSACCHDGVPLAQSDISAPYATLAVDTIPGFKSWTITTMVQEWLADPSTNFGVLLNADASKVRDRYRFFASMEHPNFLLRPTLRVSFSLEDDTTAPVIAGVSVSGITSSGATISWTTDESSDSQVEYGTTTAYGMLSTLDGALATTHSLTLSGLSDVTQYHFRVRSRDRAGNLATSADSTFTTLDGTAPAVSITAPSSAATVSGTITVAAAASDNVGVVGVQFKLDGANLGAEDASAPYSTSWNTTSVADGNHTLTATARDAAGNLENAAAITVTVSNTTPPPPPPPPAVWPNEPAGMVPFNNQPWDALTGNGWNYLRRSATVDSTIVTNSAAPLSASKELQITYTAGCCQDAEPGVHWLSVPYVKEIFTGWFVKLSSNWIPNPAGGGKITFLFTDVGGQVYTNYYHPSSDGSVQGAPYRIGANTEWAPYGQKIWLPNVTTTWINPGEYHRIEFYYKWETTPGVSGDGIIRWWVDGILNGNHTTVHYPAARFMEFQIAPTVQYAGPQNRQMFIDHAYVSIR